MCVGGCVSGRVRERGSIQLKQWRNFLMSNFILFLSLSVVLPNTIGASQIHSKSLAVAEKVQHGYHMTQLSHDTAIPLLSMDTGCENTFAQESTGTNAHSRAQRTDERINGRVKE